MDRRGRRAWAAAIWLAGAALMGALPAAAGPYAATPADLVPPLAFQNLQITTPDSAQLAAWYVPPQDSATAVREGLHPAVLLLPREDDTMDSRLPLISALVRRGFGVLTFDHRGRGGSSTFPVAPGTLIRTEYLTDAHSGLDILLTRAGVDSSRIGVHGVSRGAWLALALVGQRPRPRAVVATSVPYNAEEWIRVLEREEPGRKSSVPKDWKRSYDPDKVVRRFNGAILFIVGDRDTSTPVWMARDLYDDYPRTKDLWLVEGAAHDGERSVEAMLGAAYAGRVAAFLTRELDKPPHRGWPHR